MVRRTRAKDLRRKTAVREERRTILVFCEGEGSEPDYINGLKQLPEIRARAAVDIRVDPKHGVPFTLVQHAEDSVQDKEIDEIWCLFDVEWPKMHPNLDQAMALAAKYEKVHVAVSNPCFELWLILHFEERTAHISTDDAERRSRQLDGREGKRIDAAKYMNRRAAASERAEASVRRHAANETPFPEDNPSSSMSAFVAAVERD